MKKGFSFYEMHPEIYEEAFNEKDINEQVNFLKRVLTKHNARNVLDLACGHSPHARALAKLGFNITGLDISSSLIELAKKRAKEENVKIELHKKDMKKFDIGKFDAAYIMFSSILHLHEPEDILSHFESVNKSLKNDGIYIIDISSLPFHDPDLNAKFHKHNGKIITDVLYEPIENQVSKAKFSVTNYKLGKKINHETFTVLRYFPLALLQYLCTKTGFKIHAVFQNFKFKDGATPKQEYIAIIKKVK